MDLTTTYLGLELKNPLVPSASPLSRDVDKCRELEDAGASAIVMYSLFEEEILRDEQTLDHLMHHQGIGFGEADSFLPVDADYRTCLDNYLAQIASLKWALEIPVIASLNANTGGGWIDYARELQDAGADAIELNIYDVPASIEDPAAAVEERYLEVVRGVCEAVDLPVTVKLSPYFSSPAHFIKQIEGTGARGVSLFNRFYQPDLNLETLDVSPVISLSNSYEALLRMHWIGLMHGRVDLSLAATGGIHGADEVLKMLLVGADVTHLCSTLLFNGPPVIRDILSQMEEWMAENDYTSVRQLKGSVSRMKAADSTAYERANYFQVMQQARLYGS